MDAAAVPTPVGKVEYLRRALPRRVRAERARALAGAAHPPRHIDVGRTSTRRWSGRSARAATSTRASCSLLPNAFIGTALVFAAAVLARRAMAGYAAWRSCCSCGALMTVTILGAALRPLGAGALPRPVRLRAVTRCRATRWPGAAATSSCFRSATMQLANRAAVGRDRRAALGVAFARFRFAHHAGARRLALAPGRTAARGAAAATAERRSSCCRCAAASLRCGAARMRQVARDRRALVQRPGAQSGVLALVAIARAARLPGPGDPGAPGRAAGAAHAPRHRHAGRRRRSADAPASSSRCSSCSTRASWCGASAMRGWPRSSTPRRCRDGCRSRQASSVSRCCSS